MHAFRFAPLVLLLTACAGLAACSGEAEAPSGEKQASGQSPPPVHRTGEELARRHCASCHRFTEPALLDSATWAKHVLPQMRRRLGRYDDGTRPDSLFEQGPGGQRVKVANVFPETPRLSRAKWERIEQYYRKNAPDAPPAQPSHPEIDVGLETFAVREPSWRVDPPMTSLVQIAAPGLYVGDVKRDVSTLTILDRQPGASPNERFEVQNTVAIGSAPSALRVEGTDLYVTNMGRMPPTDDPSGRLIRLFLRPGESKYRSFETIADSLQRPVCAAFADLDTDGREDAVTCAFGFRTGRLAWHENKGKGNYESHTLRARPGAARVAVDDFDGNGRPDVMALFAQGDEGIYLYHNEGRSNGDRSFRQEPVLQFPPTYGSTSFRLADVNGDGADDLVHTAGDNADYRPVMKGYHGVRVFLNDGSNHFEEAYFFPMNGAYDAVPRDFDQDGDIDLAAISFFPDYEQSPQESFVYLENRSNEAPGDSLAFVPRTFEQSARGRWIVVDAGDLDEDGDADLVLGSFSALGMNASYVPDARQRRWMQSGPSLVVLENTTN